MYSVMISTFINHYVNNEFYRRKNPLIHADFSKYQLDAR